MLPYVPHDMTWEICGVPVIIPSQILKRIMRHLIDTWELEAATDIKAGNLTSCATDHLFTLATDFQLVLASLAEAAQAHASLTLIYLGWLSSCDAGNRLHFCFQLRLDELLGKKPRWKAGNREMGMTPGGA